MFYWFSMPPAHLNLVLYHFSIGNMSQTCTPAVATISVFDLGPEFSGLIGSIVVDPRFM